MNKQVAERNYPSNWEIVPLASVAMQGPNSFVDGPFGSDLKVNDYTESGVRVLQLQNLGDGQFVNDNVIFTSEKKAQQLQRCIAKPGDIIIAKMADPLARAAIVPTIEDRYLIVADLIKLRVGGENDARYVKYFINFADFRREAERLSTGTTRTRISLTTLKSIDLPKPPEWEQKKIADILTAVDNLIEQTEAAIHKYQAIKQGMMQDLFSRGIDIATGQLRPSRQEAPELYQETKLGWVPKEWQEHTLEQIAEFVTSGSRGWAKYYDNEGAIFLRIGNLTREHINFRFDDIIRIKLKDRSEGVRTRVASGDLLISITADLGIIAVANEQIGEAYVNQHIALIRPKDDPSLGRFLGHFFLSHLGQIQFRKYNDAGAKAGLNLPTIRNLCCLVPKNPEEYQSIAKNIDAIDLYISQLKQERDKYRSQKKGLMQDLLTGKVRVKLNDREVKAE